MYERVQPHLSVLQLGEYHQLGRQSLPAVAADLQKFTDGGRHEVFVAFAGSVLEQIPARAGQEGLYAHRSRPLSEPQ